MPDKRWVFDTVALSNFCLSHSIFILEKRYRGRCMIAWEVYDEITSGLTDYPDLKQIEYLIADGLIDLISLSRTEHKHYLEFISHLGKGEASCIAVAREQNATVVTDDRAARKQCSVLGIPFTGTIGILKASLLDGELSLTQANDILGKMIKTGFYSPIRSLSNNI